MTNDDPNPTFEAKNRGILTGFPRLDEVFGGARQGDLWLHGGFAGHHKTTFALNCAYNQVVQLRENVLFLSLDVPDQRVRQRLLMMHSAHPKFRAERVRLGLQGEEAPDVGLSYSALRAGTLGREEETFLLDTVVPDWDDPAANGHVFVESGFVLADDLRSWADNVEKERPYSMLFVDSLHLLGSGRNFSSSEERYDEAIRVLKRTAMELGGRGKPVMATFQVGPEALRQVEERHNRIGVACYDLGTLGPSHVATVADVVTTSYTCQAYVDQKLVLLGNAKSRDTAVVPPFYVRLDPTGRMTTVPHG